MNNEELEVQNEELEIENEIIDNEVEEIETESSQSIEEKPGYKSIRESQRIEKERANREAERANKAESDLAILMEYMQKNNINPSPDRQTASERNDIAELMGIGDDDFVEGKHLGKVYKEMKDLRQNVDQWRQYSEEVSAEAALKSRYSDFDEVVTRENVERFMREYPELSPAIENGTLLSRGTSAYKLINKFYGNKSAAIDRNKIRANTSKPRSATSIAAQEGDRPLARVNSMNDDFDLELIRKQMDDAINSI